jgi:hypothetical protein
MPWSQLQVFPSGCIGIIRYHYRHPIRKIEYVEFIRYLTFQNSRLIKIETGDKGSR